jgi:hypothetical protein
VNKLFIMNAGVTGTVREKVIETGLLKSICGIYIIIRLLLLLLYKNINKYK